MGAAFWLPAMGGVLRPPLRERLLRRSPARIVVVQTAFLGDTVFTSALARSLIARFPEAAVDLCVSPRGRDVALAVPGVAQVIVFDKRGADRGARGFFRMARRLRELAYDMAVLPHRSLRTALLARAAGIPERVGFAGTSGQILYTSAVPDAGATFVGREAGLARALGAQPAPMRLVARQEWLDRAKAVLLRSAGQGPDAPADAGSLVFPRAAALCLGSEWETKVWPAAHLASLARSLRAKGFTPLLLGGPRERPLAAEVLRLAPEAGCVDTTGNPVGEAMALLSLAALCVGGDTGLVHAARALGVPTVAVFGPTSPEAHDFGPRERAVSLRLACAPCSTHGSRRCPLGHHDCLKMLPATLVLPACGHVLEGA
jgi:heptosyltransferase II